MSRVRRRKLGISASPSRAFDGAARVASDRRCRVPRGSPSSSVSRRQDSVLARRRPCHRAQASPLRGTPRPVFSGPIRACPTAGPGMDAAGARGVERAVHPLSFASPGTSCCRDVTSRLRFPVGGSRACRSMFAPFIAPSPCARACEPRERRSPVVCDASVLRRRARDLSVEQAPRHGCAPARSCSRAGSARRRRRRASVTPRLAAATLDRALTTHAALRCAPCSLAACSMTRSWMGRAWRTATLNSRCVCGVLRALATCRSSRFVVHNRSPSGYLGMWGVTGSETISRKESGGRHAASS
jgi:hypothetical protein